MIFLNISNLCDLLIPMKMLKYISKWHCINMTCLNSSLDIRKRNVLTRYISHRKNMFGFQQFFMLFFICLLSLYHE